MLFDGIGNDGDQPFGDASGVGVIGVGHVFAQPGQKPGQVGPAHEEREVTVQQHAGGLAHKPGGGDGHHGAGGKHTCIAV